MFLSEVSQLRLVTFLQAANLLPELKSILVPLASLSLQTLKDFAPLLFKFQQFQLKAVFCRLEVLFKALALAFSVVQLALEGVDLLRLLLESLLESSH